MHLYGAYKVVPTAAGARFVLSEIEDILSPKNAPDITMPAVRGAGIPKPVPIPIIARPIVPTVPQDVPMEIDVRSAQKETYRQKIIQG